MHFTVRRFIILRICSIHDAGKNDFEYLPNGKNKWNAMKYEAKLKNMSEILSQLSTDKLPLGPTIIGMSEVENRRVLEDLLKQPALSDRGYEIVHYEGPDRRGVDCAFFYNPKFFQLTASKLAPYIYENNDTTYKTRGFLIASGILDGEKVHFIVNHWPSRAAASPARERAGEQVRALKDSLLNEDSNAKVIIMGDLNDDPMDKWNLFDQIVFTGNLLGNDRSTLKYFRHEIFRRDFMFQKEGKYKGYPKRTHAGGVWLNGYSDHLPTIIYLIKEQKD